MKKLSVLLIGCLFVFSSCSFGSKSAAAEDTLEPVRNVIFMIGDGMGLAQVSMLMIENGYEATAFDRAENIALIKSYSANNRVTDSAAAGTALACGVKTNNGRLGMTPDLDSLQSIMMKAKAAGKAAGFVVTSGVWHATPGSFYANVKHRSAYDHVAEQLAMTDLDVAVGGGAANFETVVDGRTILDMAKDNGFNVARNLDELAAIEDGKVLGIFAPGHLNKMSEGRGDFLEKATEDALRRLSRDEDGFFLMVEGSHIDWVCHANEVEGTLLEVADFERSVKIAMDFADQNPGTLVVITADHETGGLSMVSGDPDFTKAESGMDYRFSTTGHSGILLPVYTYGASAEAINGVMDNTELSAKILELMNL